MINKNTKEISPSSREAALSAIPIRNPRVTEEWITDEIVRLRYPLPVRKMVATVLSLFGKKGEFASQFTQLELDVQGSKVWHAIDGHRCVNEISQAVASDLMVALPDAELSVATFLRELGRRGIIGLRDEGITKGCVD